MRLIHWILIGAAALLVTACTTAYGGAGMSPQAGEMALAALDLAFKSGKISPEEYKAAIDAIKIAMQNSGGWLDLLKQIGGFIGPIVLSLLGVRVWRGGINDRRGVSHG